MIDAETTIKESIVAEIWCGEAGVITHHNPSPAGNGYGLGSG